MTRALYCALMWLLQPLVRVKLHWRARAEPDYGVRISERFGRYAADIEAAARCQPGEFFVWVHAVSLGETRAADMLVSHLRTALPGMRLLLTHGTATGRVQGRYLLQAGDVQVWQPWDSPGAVQRFLHRFRPRVGLLVETELWPNMVAACRKAQMPLCLVNARLSEKSLKQAQRLAWLSHPAYQGLSAVWAQAPEDARRLAQLGAPVRDTTGNFKFDATPDAAQLARGRGWRNALTRPVVVLASSREGEEMALLEILRQLSTSSRVDSDKDAIKNIAFDVQWMIVPRHPQRFDAVAQICQEQGFSVSRRSHWNAGPEGADIWLGDSMGEMAMYFALSDVALLGGSFAPLGGQNLIEAAACGCPVVMGPHTFNFSQAAAWAVQAGAAFEQADMSRAVNCALRLVHSGSDLKAARMAALASGAAHRGAAERTAVAVGQLLLNQPTGG
jgi:3-deoxy-D-manno-octulosonic-acid transferase